MPLSHDTASRLSTDLIGIFKLFSSLKSRMPRIHDAVEPASHALLMSLAEGPRRISSLADAVHSDVSTVSRQVSALATHGLVEKISDPADGRAFMVSLSPGGADLVEALKERRGRWFQEVLADWEPQEAEQLIALLHRFRESLEAAKEVGALSSTGDLGRAATVISAPIPTEPLTTAAAHKEH